MTEDMPAFRREPIGTDGLWTLFLSCVLIVTTLGLFWLLMLWQVWQRAARTPVAVPDSEWIVVLGKRLLGATVTIEFAQRLDRAAALIKAHPQAQIMILGGYTSEGPFSEAQQGANYLRQRGVDEAAIHKEDGSTHTLENLRNARELLGESFNRPLTLITSRYHVARSHALAAGLSLPHQLCAAEGHLELSLSKVWRFCVEAFFLHWYWVGRYWSLLTGNRKSLARIS